jgi:hypothetical protein
VRLLLTLFGRVIFDLSILEDPESEDAERTYPSGDERTDSVTLAADCRLGFVEDVGVGSTWPWE